MDLFAGGHQPFDRRRRAGFATILLLVLPDHLRVVRIVRSNSNRVRPFMSLTIAENYIRSAREQHSQQDINASLLKAMNELMRQIKRLDDEVRRARRDAQMSRRF